MKHITLEDLTPLEHEELRFGIELLGIYTAEEKQFIYENLQRGEDGLAYFYNLGNDKQLVPLYTN